MLTRDRENCRHNIRSQAVGGSLARRVAAVSLAAKPCARACRYPNRLAVRLDETILSYAALDDRSARAGTAASARGTPGIGGRQAAALPEFARTLATAAASGRW